MVMSPSCNPFKNNISHYLHRLSRGLNLHSGHCDNLLVLQNLDCETSENYLDDFCRLYPVGIVNFEHISHLVLVFLLLTLNR